MKIINANNNDVKEMLTDVRDIHGIRWSLVVIFKGTMPDWGWQAAQNHQIHVLNWSGYENAIGFKALEQ